MTSVALLERHGEREEPVEVVGPPLSRVPAVSVDAGPNLRLVAQGPELFGEDRCPLDRTRPTRLPPSTPAPMTTSPSPSAWTSYSPACAPPSVAQL
jgi:hypothetical protein